MSGVEKIAVERKRQVEKEDWTEAHDDGHVDGELAMAAACYAAPEKIYVLDDSYIQRISFIDPWPWGEDWDKREYNGNVLLANSRASKKKRIRQLVKAGALIAAEIDRLERGK